MPLEGSAGGGPVGCRGPTWLCLVSGDAAVPESAITEKKPSGYEPTLPGVRGGADVGGGGRDLRKKNQSPLQRRDPAFHSTPRPSSPPPFIFHALFSIFSPGKQAQSCMPLPYQKTTNSPFLREFSRWIRLQLLFEAFNSINTRLR